MSFIPLLIQLISGAVGGNIAGAILKKYNLGPMPEVFHATKAWFYGDCFANRGVKFSGFWTFSAGADYSDLDTETNE
jgi:hypothetical protein